MFPGKIQEIVTNCKLKICDLMTNERDFNSIHIRNNAVIATFTIIYKLINHFNICMAPSLAEVPGRQNHALFLNARSLVNLSSAGHAPDRLGCI